MSGSLHPRELVDFCLARINQFDDRLRAWVLVDADGARREADRLGELARRGEWLGPLHGIPIGIKDIVDVQGWPTRAGSPLRGETPAAADAPVVRRLREAGAILLGKTVTTEFACFDPPPTRNPWDLSRTPGGSSSGSAAAVAMEMCMAAIGSQTGGSITRPASFCGVAGLKASHGAVLLAGVVPISPRLDHVGPIGRSVLDLAAVWGAIADNREGDALLAAVLEMPLKLAVIESFFMETADDEVRRATREAIDLICGRGKGERFELPPSFADLATMHRRIMAYDAAAYHRAAFEQSPERFGPHVRGLIEFGLAITEDQYAEAVAHQSRCRAEF
ncbi:MAG: amidase, partial [Planctomycetales bacterium]|nr:amidase [Planctomycetales bacterium]